MEFSGPKYYVSSNYRIYVFEDRESVSQFLVDNPLSVEVDKKLAVKLAPVPICLFGNPKRHALMIVDLDFKHTMPEGYIGELVEGNPLEWPTIYDVREVH